MCACLRVRAGACMCLCVCIHIYSDAVEIRSPCHLSSPFALCFEPWSLTKSGAYFFNRAGWLASPRGPMNSIYFPPQTTLELQAHWGPERRSLCLQGKYFTNERWPNPSDTIFLGLRVSRKLIWQHSRLVRETGAIGFLFLIFFTY